MAVNNLNNQHELQKLNEKSLLNDELKTKDVESKPGCCRTKHTKNCCIATGVFGALFLILGVVVMLATGPMLKNMIAKSMALVDGSKRYESWLRPPVQPHLEAYAFHVLNPKEVLAGKKPNLKEVGPFVYRSTTLKDSDDNIKFWDDFTLTYRPRKLYHFVPELSTQDAHPDDFNITVPNIPYWTGIHKGQRLGGWKKGQAFTAVQNNGLNEPFINVTFSGLLWGYEDELPCLKMNQPSECASEADPFASDGDDDPWGDDDDDDGFDNMDFSSSFNKEESAESVEEVVEVVVDDNGEIIDELFEIPEDSEYEKQVKPKAEIIDCKCNWGLFRDRNVTMRKPIRIHTGVDDLSMKGVTYKYDGKTTHGWWKKGSVCDKVKGQDSSTLPPNLTKDRKLEIFIALMCRTINLEYEKDVEHAGINTLRYIPPMNALGRHDDPNEEMRNPDNECYCLENEGFRCFKSGVMYMEPCKRELQAPLALSMPHFYQADPSFLEAVDGLKPIKEKHEFFMDVVPEFGFPLAIRPRFQLNIVIKGDKDMAKISKMSKEDLVLPFLWAQDGFDEPSEEMASAIAFGLAAPEKLPMLGSVALFAIGAILLLTCLSYFLWLRRSASHNIKDSS